MADLSYLNSLRLHEIEQLLPMLPPSARLLEFGAGTGEQARFLRDRGFDVVAIDLATSNYAKERLFPVQDYDGEHIPVEDRSIDVIFSSNVLEHVENPRAIFAEFRRIQKPGGFGLHVVPTSAWRSWTFATGIACSLQAAAALPFELGTSIEGFSEIWTFSRAAWRRKFKRFGFDIVEDRPMGLFYTGAALLGDGMPLATRRRLSHVLGSGTHMYKVMPTAGE